MSVHRSNGDGRGRSLLAPSKSASGYFSHCTVTLCLIGYGVWESAVSSASGVRGGAPAEHKFAAL